jgi:hypothetical protein
MVTVYALKRKEPRVKLCTRVEIVPVGVASGGQPFETVTLDVSTCGASVLSEVKLAVGSTVRITALRYAFQANALVRTVALDRTSDKYVLGLEYLDGAKNPIVVWQQPRRATPGDLAGIGSAAGTERP